MNDDDDAFFEDWAAETQRNPLSDDSWERIRSALVSGGSSSAAAEDMRDHLTWMIVGARVLVPEVRSQLEALPTQFGPIADAADALFLHLQLSMDGDLSDWGIDSERFMADLNRIFEKASNLSEPQKRTRTRPDRDAAFGVFANFWKGKGLKTTTSIESPAVKFLAAIAAELDWLHFHDRSAENVRAVLKRLWSADASNPENSLG